MILPNGVISRSPMGLITWFDEICSPFSVWAPTGCWPHGMVDAAAIPAPPSRPSAQPAATIVSGLLLRTDFDSRRRPTGVGSCAVAEALTVFEGLVMHANVWAPAETQVTFMVHLGNNLPHGACRTCLQTRAAKSRHEISSIRVCGTARLTCRTKGRKEGRETMPDGVSKASP